MDVQHKREVKVHTSTKFVAYTIDDKSISYKKDIKLKKILFHLPLRCLTGPTVARMTLPLICPLTSQSPLHHF